MSRNGRAKEARIVGRIHPEAGTEQHVLLVDDNVAFLRAVQTALRALGYRVTAVDSGEEALSVVARAEQRFGLFLLDLNLPGIGGEEVAMQIRRRIPDARIVLVSSSPRSAPPALLEDHGRVRFLLKPFRVQELQKVCHELLSD